MVVTELAAAQLCRESHASKVSQNGRHLIFFFDGGIVVLDGYGSSTIFN